MYLWIILFHTKKKYKDADLSKIFVQMKLTVIKDIEQKNSEVPNISRFANSQNKVSELDLSSNNPYSNSNSKAGTVEFKLEYLREVLVKVKSI